MCNNAAFTVTCYVKWLTFPNSTSQTSTPFGSPFTFSLWIWAKRFSAELMVTCFSISLLLLDQVTLSEQSAAGITEKFE
jgi:hypothetical protein